MKAHWAYLCYVLRHKKFVFQEGLKLRVSIFRMILHDWQKFTLTEWSPYVHKFYNKDGSPKTPRDRTGYYNPHTTKDAAFELAWFHHVEHGPHHWQHWCISVGRYSQPVEIPRKYILEMVADWRGANRANGGNGDVREFYTAQVDKMLLAPATKYKLNQLVLGGR